MALTDIPFIWFFWALTITISNVVFGLVIYNHLKSRKIKKEDLQAARWIIIYYIIGLMFATIAASVFLVSALV